MLIERIIPDPKKFTENVCNLAVNVYFKLIIMQEISLSVGNLERFKNGGFAVEMLCESECIEFSQKERSQRSPLSKEKIHDLGIL